MEAYDKHLKKSKKVALIHVSYDRTDKAAEAWAVKDKMTWPTVLSSNLEASKLEQFSVSEYVPEYRLLDVNGQELANDKEAITLAVKIAGGE